MAIKAYWKFYSALLPRSSIDVIHVYDITAGSIVAVTSAQHQLLSHAHGCTVPARMRQSGFCPSAVKPAVASEVV